MIQQKPLFGECLVISRQGQFFQRTLALHTQKLSATAHIRHAFAKITFFDKGMFQYIQPLHVLVINEIT